MTYCLIDELFLSEFGFFLHNIHIIRALILNNFLLLFKPLFNCFSIRFQSNGFLSVNKCFKSKVIRKSLILCLCFESLSLESAVNQFLI